MAGKGGGGDVIAGRLVAELVIDAESLAAEAAEQVQQAEQAANQATSGGSKRRAKDVQGAGKDANPKVDAQVNPKLTGQIAKDVQNALNEHIFVLNLDQVSIRKQIESALTRPFEIVINGKVSGTQGEGPRLTLDQQPTARPRQPYPENVTEAMFFTDPKGKRKQAPFVGGIDQIYRNLNQALEGAGQPRIGTAALGKSTTREQTFEKVEDLIDHFGDQIDEWIKFGPTGADPVGGTIIEHLQKAGIATGGANRPDAVESLVDSSFGAFGGTNARIAQTFFKRANEWYRANPRVNVTGQAPSDQPYEQQRQAPADTQPPLRTETPPPLTDQQEQTRREHQRKLDEAVQRGEDARTRIIEEQEKALVPRTIDTSMFATPGLDKSGTRGRGSGKEIPPYDPTIAALSPFGSTRDTGRTGRSYYTLSEGQMGSLAEHPDFKAWLAANPELDPTNNPPPTTLRERGRARQKELAGETDVSAQIESGLIDRALKKPKRQRGGVAGPTPSTVVQDVGLPMQGPPSPLPKGTTQATAVPRDDKLYTEKLLNDWMANRGMRPRGEIIRPEGIDQTIDLEQYQRAAETGAFEDVYEQFLPQEITDKKGKTKEVMRSSGLVKFEPIDPETGQVSDEGVRGLERLRKNKSIANRPQEIGQLPGKYKRLDPLEAMIRTIIRDLGIGEETDAKTGKTEEGEEGGVEESIRTSIESRRTGLRASLEKGTRAFTGAQGGIRMTGSAGADPGKLLGQLNMLTEHVNGEITKLSGWIQEATKDLPKLKGNALKGRRESISRWQGYLNDWFEMRDELVEQREEVMDKGYLSQDMILKRRANPEAAAAADRQQAAQQRGMDAARVLRDKKLNVVGKQVGLSEYEKNFSEAGGFDEEGNFIGGGGGDLSQQAEGRLYRFMSTPGIDQAPPAADVEEMFKARLRASTERKVLMSGGVEGGQAAARRIAFGDTGKPQANFSPQAPGGLFGEIIGMLPEDAPRAQKKVVRKGVSDVLKGYIQDQGYRRMLADEDAGRAENLARPKRGTIDDALKGLSGEGTYTLGGPGLVASMEADIEIEKGRRAREQELPGLIRKSRGGPRQKLQTELERLQDPEWTKRESLEDVTKVRAPTPGGGGGQLETTPGLISRLEALKTLQANAKPGIMQEAEARAKTLGRGSIVSGDDLAKIFRDLGVEGPETERPRGAFADLAESIGIAEPVTVTRGGGQRRGRGDVPADVGGPMGPNDTQPPAPPGGGFEFTGGPIPVIVTNVPLAVAFSGEIPLGGRGRPDAGQMGIASSRSGSWKLADLGAQTSPEFQDEFRRVVQDLTQRGMKAQDVKKMAKDAGLGIAAAMYYGTQPSEAVAPKFPGPNDKPAYREPAGPRQFRGPTDRPQYSQPAGPQPPHEFGMPFRVLDDDFGVKTTARQRALEKAARESQVPLYRKPAGPAYDADRIQFGPGLQPTPQGQPMRTVISPQQRAIEQADRDQKAAARAQAAELKRMQRQVKVNDPEELARQRDIEAGGDEEGSLRRLRGENRAIQRRIPRRGFGASITDLITSSIGGALERQLEAGDRANQEIAEMTQASEKRAALTTTQKGVRKELGTARAAMQATAPGTLERREAQARASALREQDRKLTKDIEAQSSIIRISSGVFKENSAVVKKNTAAAFAAAAVGSIGSIGIGALTFGLGSALVAPIITAVAEGLSQGLGPSLEKLTGFGATTSRITAQAAQEIQARGGDVNAVAGIAAKTGLGAGTFESISPLIEQRAQTEAGNQALQQQLELLHTYENLRGQQEGRQFDKGLTATTGGFAGTPLFGIPSTAELLTGELESVPGITTDTAKTQIDDLKKQLEGPLDGRKRQAIQGQILQLSQGQRTEDLSPAQIDDTNATLRLFNDNLEKAGSSARFFRDETGKAAEVAAQAAEDIGQADLAATLREKGIGITGVQTGQDLQSVLAGLNRGATTPDVRLLLEDTERQRRASIQTRMVQTEFRTGTLLPQQFAMQAAQRPFTDASAGIKFGSGDNQQTRDKINADLKVTQGLYNDINKEIDLGIAAAKDFVTYGADIAGFGENVGGLGEEAGAEFAKSLDLVRSIGKDIASIEIGLQTKQAAHAAAQFSYQIGIAKRSLADAKGLAGQLTDASKDNLGVLEREQFFLQRRAQAMQLELSQKQINFQRSVAGFTAPGLTGEERAARIQQAKIEADYAQRQLNIQKELFGLQGRSFEITASRQVTDLSGQLGLLEEGREIVLHTAAAEKKIKALTAIQEKENQKVQALYEAAVESTNDIIKLTGELSAAVGKDMGELAQDVIDSYVKVYRGIITTANGTPGQGGVTQGGFNPNQREAGRHAGGNVMRGNRYEVNEQGEEFFTPGENGLISPQSMIPSITPMNGMSQSQAAPITILITGNKFNTEEELKKLEARITDAVTRAQSRQLSLLGGRSY